jgi:hypothetical protein
MGVEDPDGVAGYLGQLDRSRLDLVHRPARAVRGKHRPMATFHCFCQRPQAAASGAAAGPARGQKAEPFDGARDQFAVKAMADQYRRPEPAVKIAGTGNKAAVPETPHLESRWFRRLGALFDHGLITQGAIQQAQEQSHHSRDNGNSDPLAVAEALVRVLHRPILQFANAEVTKVVGEWGAPLPPLWTGNSEMDAFPEPPPSGIQILIMNTHKVSFASRDYSLPRSGSKPSLDDKLDKVFQMAEHMDARCVYMLDAATHKRRPGLATR